jgi:hypothetical protein
MDVSDALDLLPSLSHPSVPSNNGAVSMTGSSTQANAAHGSSSAPATSQRGVKRNKADGKGSPKVCQVLFTFLGRVANHSSPFLSTLCSRGGGVDDIILLHVAPRSLLWGLAFPCPLFSPLLLVSYLHHIEHARNCYITLTHQQFHSIHCNDILHPFSHQQGSVLSDPAQALP